MQKKRGKLRWDSLTVLKKMRVLNIGREWKQVIDKNGLFFLKNAKIHSECHLNFREFFWKEKDFMAAVHDKHVTLNHHCFGLFLFLIEAIFYFWREEDSLSLSLIYLIAIGSGQKSFTSSCQDSLPIATCSEYHVNHIMGRVMMWNWRFCTDLLVFTYGLKNLG